LRKFVLHFFFSLQTIILKSWGFRYLNRISRLLLQIVDYINEMISNLYLLDINIVLPKLNKMQEAIVIIAFYVRRAFDHLLHFHIPYFYLSDCC